MPALEQYEISPLKLWSPLQRQLATCSQVTSSPQQWIGTINNFQKKGITATEIEWSGVIPALEDAPEATLHVDELLNFLADAPPCELVLQRHISNEYIPQLRYEKLQRPTEFPPATFVNGRRELKLLHYRDRSFGICIWLHVEVDTGLFGRHRYWSLSVPHGAKKLATHPVGRRFASGQEALAYGRALIGRMARRLSQEGFVGQTTSLNRFPRYLLPGGDNYTEWLITAPNLADEYLGEHFDLPNIVAHVRTTERTSPEGLYLLVMEEIQSDWNQRLREAIQQIERQSLIENEGGIEWDDVDLPPNNPYLNHWLDAALRMMLLLASHRGVSGISWLPGKLHAERFPRANAAGLAIFYDRIVPTAMEKLAKSWGAQVVTAQFSTLSRHYCVQKVPKKTAWQVLNRESGEMIGDEFGDVDAADRFCQSLEKPVLENVETLHLTQAMRADILENGLPCLGAIGKRAVAAVSTPTS